MVVLLCPDSLEALHDMWALVLELVVLASVNLAMGVA